MRALLERLFIHSRITAWVLERRRSFHTTRCLARLLRMHLVESCFSMPTLLMQLFLVNGGSPTVRKQLQAWLLLPTLVSATRLPLVVHLQMDSRQLLSPSGQPPANSDSAQCMWSCSTSICPGTSALISAWYVLGLGWCCLFLHSNGPGDNALELVVFLVTFTVLLLANVGLCTYALVAIGSPHHAFAGAADAATAAAAAVAVEPSARSADSGVEGGTGAVAPPPPSAATAQAVTAGAAAARVEDFFQQLRPFGGLPEQVLMRLPTFKHGSGGEHQFPFGPTCSICLVDFETGDELRELPCRHIFHTDCIDLWLREHRNCPLRCPPFYHYPRRTRPSSRLASSTFRAFVGQAAQVGASHEEALQGTDVLEATRSITPNATQEQPPLSQVRLSAGRLRTLPPLGLPSADDALPTSPARRRANRAEHGMDGQESHGGAQGSRRSRAGQRASRRMVSTLRNFDDFAPATLGSSNGRRRSRSQRAAEAPSRRTRRSDNGPRTRSLTAAELLRQGRAHRNDSDSDSSASSQAWSIRSARGSMPGSEEDGDDDCSDSDRESTASSISPAREPHQAVTGPPPNTLAMGSPETQTAWAAALAASGAAPPANGRRQTLAL